MLLWSIIQGLLACSDERVMEILAQELEEKKAAPGFYEDLLYLEPATAALDKNDREALQQEHANAKAHKKATREFRKKFKAKRKEMKCAKEEAEALAKGKGKGKGKEKGKGKGKGKARGPNRLPKAEIPPGCPEQRQLKPLCPPGAHIWRGNRARCWSGHYPGFCRVSVPWTIHPSQGFRVSGIYVLRQLWQRHLWFHGLDESECPVAGLFGTDAEIACDDLLGEEQQAEAEAEH